MGAVLYYGTCSAGGDCGENIINSEYRFHAPMQSICKALIIPFFADTASVCVYFLYAVAWINGTELEGSVYLRGNE